MISTDASNFYDQVAHPFTCLTSQNCGLELPCLLLLVKTIQSMKMVFHTAYGTSSSHYSIPCFRLFQWVTHGNWDAPVLWMIMSIILIRHLYLKGLASPHYSPISQMMFSLIVLINVDDTDLNVLNLEGKSSIESIEIGQIIIDDWQFSIWVSGRDLKLEKCSWTFRDY